MTSPVGIILAVILALIGGWLLVGKTCSGASDADKEMDRIQEELRSQSR